MFKPRPYLAEMMKARMDFIKQFTACLEGKGPAPEKALRTMLCLWRRQAGKTTGLALLNLWDMMRRPGSLTVFASASLLVGREVIEKQSVLLRDLLKEWGVENHARLSASVGENGADVFSANEANWAEAYESRRLVIKLHHDENTYSRMQVVAPNPATARGFSGSVIIDEIGWIPDFGAVWDAMEPILSSDPTFTCLLATTPPADDTHLTYELMLPPRGTEFPVNARGNWYVSERGMNIHRVDAWDGVEAGAAFRDNNTGQIIPPEEHRARAYDRNSWDRNYALKFIASGTAAISRPALEAAMAHAKTRDCRACDCAEVPPYDWVYTLRKGDRIGLGLDIATTTNKKSNFSSLSACIQTAFSAAFLLIWRWKTAETAEFLRRVRAVIEDVITATCTAPHLCVDASSEVLFASNLRDAIKDRCRVTLVRSGDTLQKHGQSYTHKEYLGDLYTNTLEDRKVALPSAKWLFEDHRLVTKDKGRYSAAIGPDGCHADSFDSNKLALFALERGGPPPLPICAARPNYSSPSSLCGFYDDGRTHTCI